MFLLIVECPDGVLRHLNGVRDSTPEKVTLKAIALIPQGIPWGIWDCAAGDFVPNNYAMN